MNISRVREHTVDFAFTLALFLVFAASALAVVILSLQSYQSITSQSDDNYFLRTSTAYISQKVRHMDEAGAVSIGKLGDTPALVLTQDFNGFSYDTYIYSYDGHLMELFVPSDNPLSPSSGTAILPLAGFSVDSPTPNTLQLGLESAKGTTHLLTLTLRT